MMKKTQKDEEKSNWETKVLSETKMGPLMYGFLRGLSEEKIESLRSGDVSRTLLARYIPISTNVVIEDIEEMHVMPSEHPALEGLNQAILEALRKKLGVWYVLDFIDLDIENENFCKCYKKLQLSLSEKSLISEVKKLIERPQGSGLFALLYETRTSFVWVFCIFFYENVM
ncbi:MAG TPA: hypothetical protein PKC14_02830 [Candidatus Absconditabacterales bacterium]|nr:hypothetical protein [Candidatus Absconditabacterales bacterium]